jgi:hypothetical protein
MDVFRKHDIDFIGIQETKSINFSDRHLNSLSGGKLFCWKWLPSTGAAGGILMGIDIDVFEVENWIVRDFSVSYDVTRKKGELKCRITTVYGAADESKKIKFLNELNDSMANRQDALIIWGDFNLVRSQVDKSSGIVDLR